MNFFLEHDKDQALLAMVIQEGHEAARKRHKTLGRVALQKTMYFLKAFSVPMGYRFEIYHYGPFCAEIQRDTEWLILDEIVEDTSEHREDGSNYVPGAKINLLLETYPELEDSRKYVRTISEVFAPLSSSDLEVYATLHYLFMEEKAKGGSGPWQTRVVDRFEVVKRNKFAREKVEEAYARMVTAKIIPA